MTQRTSSVPPRGGGSPGGTEAGHTIVELLIGAIILGLVLALTFEALVTGQRVTSETATQTAVEATVATALGLMSSDLRQSGGPSSGSGFLIDASPEGGANQRVSFRKVQGFDVAARQTVWSPATIQYWYDAAGQRVKRQEGTGAISIVATGIDPGFSFALGADQVTITITALRDLTTDGRRVTVSTTEKVALRN